MDSTTLKMHLDKSLSFISEWASGPQLYVQLGLVLFAIIIAYSVTAILKRFSPIEELAEAEIAEFGDSGIERQRY